MARKIEITPVRTYKTKENAIKATERFEYPQEIVYFVMQSSDGRYFPVFVGQIAIQHGVHFNFNVVG